MNWWKILKNAKISGKTTGKGSSFDASKIKINIDKKNCKEELKRILSNALDITLPESASPFPSKWLHKNWIDANLSEKRACDFIKSLKFKSPINKEDIEDSLGNIKRIDVGSHQFKNDIISITRETIFERPKTRKEGYRVSLTAKSEWDDVYDTFVAFNFATKEEYNKWVNSI
jgi:hypothetical protein